MQVHLHVIRMLISIAAIITAASGFAADGQLEINQACAVNTGCFTGDAPGFPVTITTPGSYRLTGSLDLSAEGVNVSGIEVNAPATTVDLGGFHVAGATTCSGSGASISCSPSSSGGSAGVHFMSNATASVVQNGIVRNMTNYGIRSQATGLRVQDITAIHNGADGINGTSRTSVVNSVSIENGQDGIVVNLGSVVDGVIASGNGRHGILDRNKSVLTRSSAQGNAGRGFYALAESKFGKNNLSASNGEADLCGFGECTERRRIFLTKTLHKGDTVLTACSPGFHVASQTELYDIGQYHYDNILGTTSPEGVTGAPLGKLGWVRVGGTPASLENCFGWTRAVDLDHVGGVVHLQVAPPGGAPLSDSIVSSFRSCAFDHPVWCVEDN